ncbi:MAG: helix-turn-helix domain-containing protein [Pseudomonadota bacterium]
MTPERREARFPSFFGEFPDPATMAMVLSGYDAPVAPPSAAVDPSLHSMLARGAPGPLNVALGRFGRGIAQSYLTTDTHTFVFPTEAGVVRRNAGHDLRYGHLFHFRPNAQTYSFSPEGMPWAFGIIVAPKGSLTPEGGEATGLVPAAPLDDDRLFLAPAPAISRLVELTRDFARVARDMPWVIDQPAPGAAISGALTHALLTCLAGAEVEPDRAALGRHRQIIARFEDALGRRPEEMLSVAAICAAVGVAERTLSLVCQEFLGQSALQYARGRRLDLVRLRLLLAEPGQAQVTTTAMHYGFWELGRFARAYRLRFGEQPSGPSASRRASPTSRPPRMPELHSRTLRPPLANPDVKALR